MIRSKDAVLMRVIQHQLRSSKLGEGEGLSVEEIANSSRKYLTELEKMRASIYGEHKDNDLLFMYLVTLLEKVNMTFCLPALIEQNSNP